MRGAGTAARGRDGSGINVWPAFTDAMLAFVLVLVLMLAYQVGRSIRVGSREITLDQAVVESLLDSLASGTVKYKRGVGRHDLRFGSAVLFETGSAELNPQGQALLRGLASSIAERQLKTLQEIQVSGHTDNVSTRGTSFETNWELSSARATEVVRSLVESGLDPSQVDVSATGYAEFNTVEDNAGESGRALNRRIEMRLIYGPARERSDANPDSL